MTYWPLLGVGVVVVGFVLRKNPVLVVVVAGVVSAVAAGMGIGRPARAAGHVLRQQSCVAAVRADLPVIGLLEHYGLRERAQE